jgi:hypothetical protein
MLLWLKAQYIVTCTLTLLNINNQPKIKRCQLWWAVNYVNSGANDVTKENCGAIALIGVLSNASESEFKAT